MAVEKPNYEVVQKFDDFEIRQYESMIIAEVIISGTREEAGDRAFRPLADFIFGKNKKRNAAGQKSDAKTSEEDGEKIGMTAPVTQTEMLAEDLPARSSTAAASPGKWTVQFVMPRRYTLETLPQPLSPDIRVRQVPPSKVAAFTYSGSWSESRYLEKLADFRKALVREKIQTVGEPQWARYDPPFMPRFLRRNEILFAVR